MLINGKELEIKPHANLRNADLTNANLRYADLTNANLTKANLYNANLTNANLRNADLYNADLTNANLYNADLTNANLTNANLYNANLRYADLYNANLTKADLRNANLTNANLHNANLTNADLPRFQIPQEGSLIVWKKLQEQVLAKLLIPTGAKRTASLVGRKCRAEYVYVLDLYKSPWKSGCSFRDLVYEKGEYIYPDTYDGDIRVECSSGIHFFLTREEAEEFEL